MQEFKGTFTSNYKTILWFIKYSVTKYYKIVDAKRNIVKHISTTYTIHITKYFELSFNKYESPFKKLSFTI